MQLTSPQGIPQSLREHAPSAWTRVNHPVAAAALACAGWLGFVIARYEIWAKGHLSLFVLAGSGHYGYTHRGLPPGLMIADPGAAGYDGQFYYRLALNPFNWAHTAYGITMDQPYRYTRIGYPFLTWVVSAGQHTLVPAALIAINVLGVAAMAWLGAMFARDNGRHALWGLLCAGYFGLVISVGRDTAEPLAEACMLAGLLAYRRNRWLLSGVAFAYGAITRETILIAPAAIALIRVAGIARGTITRSWTDRTRPGLADLAWLMPAAAYGGLQVIGKLVLHGQSALAADGSRNLSTPFSAMVQWIRYDIAHITTSHLGPYDIALLEYATLAVFIVAGFAVIGLTSAPWHERIAFVLFVLQLGLISAQIWSSTSGDFGDGRSLIEPYLLALILLLATPKRYLNGRLLGLIAAAALPALAVVARRRILYM